MFISINKLSSSDKKICLNTVSTKAIFAIVGDALTRKKSISIVRMGDGEKKILATKKSTEFFDYFDDIHKDWGTQLGVKGMPIENLRKNILAAGNHCTYFAPSVSGIQFPNYSLYKFFKPREFYFDNFFVNDWSAGMIKLLLETAKGIFVIHRDYKKIINNFKTNYDLNNQFFDGFQKESWCDNEQAIETAINSKAQLILFSAGPGGKIIGPKIAKAKNKIVLDVGNTLIPWSEMNIRKFNMKTKTIK